MKTRQWRLLLGPQAQLISLTPMLGHGMGDQWESTDDLVIEDSVCSYSQFLLAVLSSEQSVAGLVKHTRTHTHTDMFFLMLQESL